MSRTFDPRLDILPPPQRRIWPELAGAGRIGFVLYGGTAIALRLGHRSSVDFDFFSERRQDRAVLQRAIPRLKRAAILQDSPDGISALLPVGKSTVKVSFFSALRIGRLGVPEWTSDGVIQAASAIDLLATKLKVLPQRVEAKDYQDIAALLRSGVDLTVALSGARALYGPAFQPTECLKALTYFEGGDLSALAPADRSALIDAVGAVRALPKSRRRSRALGAVSAEAASGSAHKTRPSK